jgi:hypothetical protein
MNDIEQIIVFDTLKMIQSSAPLLVKVLNERSTASEAEAYKSSVYAAVIRLSSLFKPGEMELHEERHRKDETELEAYLDKRDNGMDEKLRSSASTNTTDSL